MAAHMASRQTMSVPLKIHRFLKLGNFTNLSPPQNVQGMTFSRLFCSQSQQPTATSKQKIEEKKDPSLKYVQQFNPELVKQLSAQVESDMPLRRMPDPFEKKYRKCLLCEKDVDLDWKNVRLLSQFVSPFTGRIYGRHITQLCIPMQKRVARLIKRARVLGYMAYMNKDPQYLNDPRLFNPLHRRNK
ncbi:28S ribosomal protein S18c, mitochondrial-like [Haliotis rufescens]|uniref:28S ribosomal protein S18c, mitochondrial-like n=1 Tax=Haliotis rufescens TaxID=6454 RepID=UPI00201FB0F7|nr:28S ribosomal protein S18c, mitochondrial-like [Haliotis rufescens]